MLLVNSVSGGWLFSVMHMLISDYFIVLYFLFTEHIVLMNRELDLKIYLDLLRSFNTLFVKLMNGICYVGK